MMESPYKLSEKHVKAIFFDFDETLVATSRSTDLAYEKIEKLIGQREESVSYSDLKKHISSCTKDVIQHYKNALSIIPNEEYKSKVASEIRTELWKNSILSTLSGDQDKNTNIRVEHVSELASELYNIWHTTRNENLDMLEPDTIEVLKKLRDSNKLVLITNGCSSVQWEKIKASGIKKYFDFLIVSGDEPEDKPHSSIFLKACSLCELEPKQCAMVGDSIHTDILGANTVGLAASIHICLKGSDDLNNYDCKQPMCIPTHNISSISQLLNIFK